MPRKKKYKEAKNPLILRSHRLMEAFAKSDDEREFCLDRVEGFIVYVDLDKSKEEIAALEKELESHADRYRWIPKLTFYEAKKIMEGFVHEKVYDIDTKEKLLDIIQSKEAREHFLEFIYDHHNELEKWQQYYQERGRIRIIEWLRNNQFNFVFEEDLDLSSGVAEKLKRNLFEARVSKDVAAARKVLAVKAKTYYSNEALNPRPKRGRPPKQAVKMEVAPRMTVDIYTSVPAAVRPFLFTPEISSASAVTFSEKFGSEDKLLSHRKNHLTASADSAMASLNQKLASLRSLSRQWVSAEEEIPRKEPPTTRRAVGRKPAEKKAPVGRAPVRRATATKKSAGQASTKKSATRRVAVTKKVAAKKTATRRAATGTKASPKKATAKKGATKKTVAKKNAAKKAVAKKTATKKIAKDAPKKRKTLMRLTRTKPKAQAKKKR